MICIKRIGQGGFGNVDLIQDTDGYQFARKTFSINQAGSFPEALAENVRRRFIREAETQATFHHYNIMPLVSTDLHSIPPSFIMPLATSTLGDDIEKDRSLGGRQIQAIMDILSGLEELHSIGITHRDLKPQNVLRFDDGNGERYVISDFGLMSVKDTQLSALTQTGMKMGSDFYTAPEIVADLRKASAASDIYSVGCILHDMFSTTYRVPCQEVKDVGPFADIISYCTKQDPKRRFQSVADLRDAITSIDQEHLTAVETQVTDFIELLAGNGAIDRTTWERIIRKVEKDQLTQDIRALLASLSLDRINEIIAVDAELATSLCREYASWVRIAVLEFGRCDGIANRLQAFLQLDDVSCTAEVIIAMLLMGTSHNRWYVEEKFVSLCANNMPETVARRVGLELRVLGQTACNAIAHLERSIGFNRTKLHPHIVDTLNRICVT